MSETQVHVDFWNEYYAAHASNPRAQEWRVLCADVNGRLIEAGLRAANQKAGRMIEIGCGDGALIVDLMGRGWAKSVVGYEISETAAEYVRSRQIDGVEYVRAFDGISLPEPDDSFDLAVLSEVIEHAERPVDLLREAKRLASLVAVQVVMTDTLAARRRANRVEEEEKLHRPNKFNLESARAALRHAGLKPLHEQVTLPSFAQRNFWSSGAKPFVKNAVAATLSHVPGVGHRLFGSTYTAICARERA